MTHATDERTARRVFAAIGVATLLVTGTATVAAFDGPLDRNATVTDEYAAAYAPFEDDGPPTDAVVFLPPVHGPWLNHPFQALRNEPGFDGPTVYALPEHRFRVVDAYPDRAHYRYVYRGTWNPYDGSPVTPALQRVHVVRGERVTADASVAIPSSTTTTSMRLATSRGYAYYTAPATDGTQQVSIVVDEDGVRLEGPGAESTGTGHVPLASTDEVVVELNANTEGGDVLYRLVLPVDEVDGERRALTPTIEVCSVARLCGGEGAVVPDAADSTYTVNVTMHAE